MRLSLEEKFRNQRRPVQQASPPQLKKLDVGLDINTRQQMAQDSIYQR